MLHLRKNKYTYGAYVAVMVLLTAITFGDLSTHLFDTDDRENMGVARVLEDPAYLFSPERTVPVRPLTDVVWATGYLIWGANPASYHILLVILHLLASLFLAWVLHQLGIDLELSLLTSVLFLMNVAHFRAVQWLTCMVYVLMLIAALCVLLFYDRYLKANHRKWLLLAAAALGLAVITHPSSTSVALFCLYMAYRREKTLWEAIASSWLLGTIALLFTILSYQISPQVAQVKGLFVLPDPVSIATYFLWYLSRLITNAHWLIAGLGETPTWWELGIGVLACVGVFLLFWRKQSQMADWGVWALLSILPFIHRSPEWQYLPFGPSRQLYLASIGSSLILAWIILSVARRIETHRGRTWRQITFGALLTGILGSSMFALKRCEAASLYSTARSYIARGDIETGSQQLKRAIAHAPYLTPPDAYARAALALCGMGKSPEDILKSGLSIYPDAPVLNLYLGIWQTEQRDTVQQAQGKSNIQSAFALSTERDQLRLDAATCYYNLGTYHAEAGAYEKAARFFRKSLTLRPDDPNTTILLGNALHAQGRVRDAVEMFQRAIQIQPEHAGGHHALGFALDAQGKRDAAIDEYRKALQIDPNNARVHFHLAGALYSRGQIDESLRHVRRAIGLDPQDPLPYRSLAVILAETGRRNAAIDTLKIAAELTPNHAETWHSLAILYRAQECESDAIAAYRRAIALVPDDWEAHLGLAQVLEKLGRVGESIEAYRQTLSLNPNSIVAQNALRALAQ